MSSEPTFVDLCLAGKATPDDIDDFVDQWHQTPGGRPLHDHLGMTDEEYSLWLRVPDALPFILEARRGRIPLRDAVKHECRKLRQGASTGEKSTIARLEEWLKAKGAAA